MKPPNSAVQVLTRRLLAHEAGERSGEATPDPRAWAAAAERAADKLRVHLSKLLGTDGFRVLLRRAVTLARAEFPAALEGVEVQTDGSLRGLAAAAEAASRAAASAAAETPGAAAAETPGSGSAAAAAVEAVCAVPSHFLGLLKDFIGPDLTLRLVQGVWPEIDPPLRFEPDAAADPEPGLRDAGAEPETG